MQYKITHLDDFIEDILNIIEDDMDYYLGHNREELERKIKVEITEDDDEYIEWEGRLSGISKINE